MYLSNQLRAIYKEISNRCDDSNRVFQAMIRATKNTMMKENCKNRCQLLRELKRLGIATNDVENCVERIGRITSSRAREQMKMRIMRWKIDDAFKDLRKKQYENVKVWRECKKIIPLNFRGAYLTQWKRFIASYVSLL